MKVVCISNVELSKDSNGKSRHTVLPLTIGKVYESILDGEIKVQNVRFYMIEDNNGKITHYAANHFVTLDVWREVQINRIL